MGEFHYKGRSATGEAMRGRLTGASSDAVANRLLQALRLPRQPHLKRFFMADLGLFEIERTKRVMGTVRARRLQHPGQAIFQFAAIYQSGKGIVGCLV